MTGESARVVAEVVEVASYPDSFNSVKWLGDVVPGMKLVPESALAELSTQKDGVLHKYVENVSAEMEELLARAASAENKHATLLSGLEALAGEWEAEVKETGLGSPVADAAMITCAIEIRDLVSSCSEGK